MSTPESGGRRPMTPRAKARMFRLLAFILTLTLVGLLFAAVWVSLFRPALGSGTITPVQIEIKPGSGTPAIARKLQATGVIGSAQVFRFGTRLFGADSKLRPGVYDLTTGMSVAAVLDVLKAGPQVAYVTVTIPEGYVIDQIADRLEKQAGIPRDEFIRLAKTGAKEFEKGHPYATGAYGGSLEGYLFPKTYRIREGSSAREVIEMMLDQFDREITQVDVMRATNRGLGLSKVVTLASMIERESRLDNERPLIASVIYNRLKTDSLLKIDATIQYVLGGNRLRLTNADTRVESPYNTYLHKGLPPGPICNPGLKSLQAAAAPPDTQLLYYVLTGRDGSHTFTTNLEEFLAAKKKSKQVFGE